MAGRPFRVFLAGTFDGLHAGHLHVLEFARRRGESLAPRSGRDEVKLFAVVGRDANVKRIKGSAPLHSERERLELLKSLRQVDEALLGHEKDFLKSVRRVRPDLVVLGHDQRGTEARLKELGYTVARCPPYNRSRLRTSKFKKRGFEKRV